MARLGCILCWFASAVYGRFRDELYFRGSGWGSIRSLGMVRIRIYLEHERKILKS